MTPGDGTRAVHAGLPAPRQGEPLVPGPAFASYYHLEGDPEQNFGQAIGTLLGALDAG